MPVLFQRGLLADFLAVLVKQALGQIEQQREDDILTRPVDELVQDCVLQAHLEPLVISEDPIDGSVDERMLERGVEAPPDPLGRRGYTRGYRVEGVYPYRGDARLFEYEPSHHLMVVLEGVITADDVRVAVVAPQSDRDLDVLRQLMDQQLGRIRQMAAQASAEAERHNAQLEDICRRAVLERRDRVMRRRGLAGALGFPLTKRTDAPHPVPLARRQISVRPCGTSSGPYRDEPALSDAQYEEALAVVRSTLLAMERSPSVASSKKEEELRDQILVQLNGTFQGAATGETFVHTGKTDILLRVEDRHVFVAECKWWDGPKACSEAVDQLLSYLPWRDEKAALLLFIDRKDATAAIDAADDAIRGHPASKRGLTTDEPSSRRNYVLGHPDDPAREIKLATLFAVLPREARGRRQR